MQQNCLYTVQPKQSTNLKTNTRKSWMLVCIGLFLALGSFAQSKEVGKIISPTGSPIEGAFIVNLSKHLQTYSDSLGSFSINASEGDSLKISHVGFNDYAFLSNGNGTVKTINLIASTQSSLEDVIVVGYGSQKKATLTGSISVLKGQDLVKSPQPNVSNSLAGRVSGVIANNRGGEPGYDGSNITIRGLATTGNNDVLVVVDGVPGQIGGLQRLDPNDIESMSILKDASAAIYGSRAANGVILITTKRGKSGKPSISYSFNQGFSSPTRLPKMANASTYATIMNEIAYYTNKDGGMNQYYSDAEIQKFADGSDPVNYPNTDWEKATLRGSAPQSQHSLSVSGGSDNIKYYVSLGTISQDGLYKNGVTKYNQYNFRSNIDAKINDRLTVGLYLSGREEDRIYPQASAGNIFRSIYRAYPTIAAYNPDGTPTTGIEYNNPVVMGTDIGGTNKNPTQVFNGILKGTYKLVAGFSLDGFFSVDKSFNFYKSFSKPYNLYSYNSATDVYTSTIVGGTGGLATLGEGQTNQTMRTSNIKLNFNRKFGDHNIDAFIGYEQSETNQDVFAATRLNFPTTATPELSQGGAALADRDNSGSSYNYTRRSYLGRVAYNYKEKYLLEWQGRIDGSSTFPSSKRYGFFPSISGGWRITKESWFNVPFINDLKVRASYGQLGNDNVDLFQYFSNYSFNNQYVINNIIVPGVDLTKLANPNITWEVAKKTDIGINGLIFKNINFEFVYFNQRRSKILTQRNASIPTLTGIVNPYGGSLVPAENIGEVSNHGIEATLGYNGSTSNGFTYGVSGNFTYAKNKIIFIDEAADLLAYQKQTGGPMNTYLLYQAEGIFRTQADLDAHPHLANAQLGDLIYKDVNNDGVIDANDMVRTKDGNIPRIMYGLVLNAGYKGFDFSAVFSGQAEVKQYVVPESGTVGNFYSSWADNRWSPSNPNGSYPRVDTRASSSINGGQYPNTFWLNNASFLRFKNVELGYNFKGELLSKVKINSLRLYVNAFNLFTITKVKDYDPEGDSGSGQFYPQQKIINFGINLKF